MRTKLFIPIISGLLCLSVPTAVFAEQPVSGTVQTATTQPVQNPETASKIIDVPGSPIHNDWIQPGWQQIADNNPEAALAIWQQGVNRLPPEQLLAFIGIYSRRSDATKQLKRIGPAEKAIILYSDYKEKKAYYVMSAQDVPVDHQSRRKKLASLARRMAANGKIYANAASKFQVPGNGGAIAAGPINQQPSESDPTPQVIKPSAPTVSAVKDTNLQTGSASTPDSGGDIFNVTGNSLVSTEAIDQRLQSLAHKKLSRDMLFQARQSIMSLYKERGFDHVAIAIPETLTKTPLQLHIYEDDIHTSQAAASMTKDHTAQLQSMAVVKTELSSGTALLVPKKPPVSELEGRNLASSRQFVDTASLANISSDWVAQGWRQLDRGNTDAALAIWQQGVNSLPAHQLLAFLGIYSQMPAAIKQLKRAGMAEKAIILHADLKGKKAYFVMSARDVPADKSMRREKLASLYQAINVTGMLYANAAGKFQTEMKIAVAIPATATFTIKTFNIIGNTLIADATFQEALRYYTGNNKTREDLIAAKQAILRLYRDEGYEMVAVGLPRKITGNTIPIRVFEARIGKVWVSGGTKKTGKGIKSAMSALKSGETANADLLDEQLRAISRKNNVKAAQLVYHPTKNGVVDVEIMVDETNPMKIGLMASSLGTQETGQTLLTGIFYHDNLWNAGHKLTLSYTVSEKVRNLKLYSAMYQIPVVTLDGNLILSMSRADVASGQVLGVLDSRGNGTLKSIHYEQTLFRTASSRHYLDIGYEQHLFHERFSNVFLPFTLSTGILAKPVVLGYGFESDNDYGQFGLHVSYYHNTPVGTQKRNASYRLLNPAAFANWNLLRLGVDYQYDWENGWSFSSKAGGQISNNALIAGERFYITGMSKVRGFEEVEASGDTAFFLRTQLTSPNWLPEMRFHAFVDAGRYKLNFPFPGEFGSDKIVSTGLGAHWTPAFGLDVMAEAGIVLNSLPVAPNGSMTGHFKVIYWFQ